MDLSAVIAHWLHLMSAIIWIGAAAYQVFVLSPMVKSGSLPPAIVSSLAKRYRLISIATLVILFITGFINFKTRRMGFDAVPGGYVSALAVKAFLAVALGSGLLFGIIRSSSKYDDESEKEDSPPQFGANKMTLAIGSIVIFIAAMLRLWVTP